MNNVRICITIDDAPSPDFREKVDFLYKHKVPAIFFCIGELIELDPEAIVYAARKGFLIGNHSYSHKPFSGLPLDNCYDEIVRTDRLISRIFHENGIKVDRKFFRFPYGDKGDLRYGLHFSSFSDGYFSNKPFFKWAMKQSGTYLSNHLLAKQELTGIRRKERISQCLRQNGYSGSGIAVSYDFYHALSMDPDWSWTYDSTDWLANDERSMEKYREHILLRIDEKDPYDPRGTVKYPGLLQSTSDEILLMHDYAKTSSLFYDFIGKLMDRGCTFIDP